MRIPADWLKEYVPNDLSVKELADTLTDVGLEVEAIEEVGGTAVLDIKVTPNRGDCLAVLGAARELAMKLRREMQTRAPTVTEAGPPAASLASVVLEAPAECPRYSARIVRGVKIGPSPAWAQRRLELCGLRPISNVVDATNLVMLELGQPLHAFDYGLLRAPGGDERPQIVVRMAREGERLVTIDGEERELNAGVLLIADPSRPIALAGIMGGAATEIHSGTTDVLLESAHFDPGTIRRGARSLGLSTEASYRFERTVDPGGTVRALDRACELIAEFCQGGVEVAPGVVDAYPDPVEEVTIALRPAHVNRLLGLSLSGEAMAEHLRRLQLAVVEADPMPVTVPTFRQDLKTETDLVEEVARAAGYDSIPERLPTARAGLGRLPEALAFEREVRGLMRGLGLSEAVTSSLEAPEGPIRLGFAEGEMPMRLVKLSNAKTRDRSQLRVSLLTTLLEVVSVNRRYGVTDVGLFDLGRVYGYRGEEKLPEQPQHLAVAATGLMGRGRWTLSREWERWDLYALKGVVENLVSAVARGPAEFSPVAHPALRPGQAASIVLGGEMLGVLGEVRPTVREGYDLPDPVYVAELDLEALRGQAAGDPRYEPPSRFPSVTRDVALLLPREMPAQRAEAVIRESAGADLARLSLFDAYEGKPLPEGQRNLAFSLTFQRNDRTLRDEEVEAAMERVRQSLREELNARIRE